MSLISLYKNDPLGDALGTGYKQFQSLTGIHGLCKLSPGRIDLLVVMAPKRQERRGKFRQFIQLAKQEFHTIAVWHVQNPILESALDRYGFHNTSLLEDDELVIGKLWNRPATVPMIP